MYFSDTQIQLLQEAYDKGKLPATPKEEMIINPKVAIYVSEKDIANSVPVDLIHKYSKLYGDISKVSMQDPVKNTMWDYLYFVNPDVFRPAAIAFQKSKKAVKGTNIAPSYTNHIKGTKAYNDFWEEEFNRIKYGYEPIVDGKPCGIRISGEFYFYLNYSLMDKLIELSNGETKVVYDFPDFMLMDYYYYRELEARENPHLFGLDATYKKSLVLAKSRRKGFSYKAAAGCVWIIAFNNKARVGIASAPDVKKTDAALCAQKCIPVLDHLTDYTPFGRKDPGDPSTNGGWAHEKASITNTSVNITLGLYNTKTKGKAGRQSTVFTMSLSKDDAASGEGLRRLYFEEAGKIGNLDKAWIFARETMKAGSLFRGLAILFGTGGQMMTASGREGTTKPFAQLFNNPKQAELASFSNIHEYKELSQEVKCGWFVADMWANFGAYVEMDGTKYQALDKKGNPCFWVGELVLNKERLEKAPPKGKQEDYNKFLTQRCKTPSEAFLVSSGSIFNTADLIARQSEIKMSVGGFSKFRTPGELIEKGSGEITFIPDLEHKLKPIISLDVDVSDREGCLLLYEYPRTVGGKIPEDAYIITVDPIANNNEGGSSLNAVYVFKTPKYSNFIGYEGIVASYVGRKKQRPLSYLHQLLFRLSKFYNAKISFENDRDGGILQYFTTRNALHMLMPKPDLVLQKHLPNSKTRLREFGHSMASARHKGLGEQYLNEWLDYRHPSKKVVNEEGEVVEVLGKRNLDMLLDEYLIEELIQYNRQGNYDAVLSCMGAVIQFKERFEEADTIEEDTNVLSEALVNYYNQKYSNDDYYSNYRYNSNDQNSVSASDDGYTELDFMDF
jgi:hypothetical protein